MTLTHHITILASALLLLIMGGGGAVARTVTVTSPSAINGRTYAAGDTIVIPSGTYSDQRIVFTSTATASHPIVLRAEELGKVVLTGQSTLSISGSYLEVHGLRFKEGYSTSGNAVVQFRSNSSSLASHCRLTECAIENYNPTETTTDYKWVSLYGQDNRVDNCYFVNKAHMGTLMVVWLVQGDDKGVNHTIEKNYFGYRTPLFNDNGQELNGQEIIRLGDSSTSLQPALCYVTNNFFERTNGEIEIISNKSCYNTFRNNLFYECVGMLTLRHGNHCTVDGNWFFGNGVKNSGGIRIIGENHTVCNNYLHQLGGSGYRAAICIVRGEVDNALSGYAQVKGTNVMFNTIADCKSAMEVSYGSGSSQTLAPITTTIAHNVARQSGTNNALKVHASSPDVAWDNNILYGGTITSSNKPSAGIISSIDPSFTNGSHSGYTFVMPSATSPLEEYRTSSAVAGVTSDIWRTPRPLATRPGAMENNPVSQSIIPSALSCGPTWMQQSTATSPPSHTDTHTLHYLQYSRSILSSVPLQNIALYSPDGVLKAMLTPEETNGETSIFNLSSLASGLYIAVGKHKASVLTTTFIIQ